MSTTDDLASGTIELETDMRPQRLWVLPPIIVLVLIFAGLFMTLLFHRELFSFHTLFN